MTEFHIDLEAYFTRIGYAGPRVPSLETLKAIILQHHMSIAFENIDSFAGVPVEIDPAAIERKTIKLGRGGYCHEQNQYLSHVLRALGFDVRLRMARVRWMVPPDVTPQRGHMTLNVAVGGDWYLCDVAFGAMTPTGPLLLSSDAAQRTPHQTYRLAPRDGSHHLDVQIGEDWRPVYSFDQVNYYPVDFQAANWLVSTYPKSEFVNNLIVARPTADRRQILNNNGLAFRYNDGRVEKTTLSSAAELRAALTTMFGIRVPSTAQIDKALSRIFESVAHEPA